jgi:hypothetical protein
MALMSWLVKDSRIHGAVYTAVTLLLNHYVLRHTQWRKDSFRTQFVRTSFVVATIPKQFGMRLTEFVMVVASQHGVLSHVNQMAQS